MGLGLGLGGAHADTGKVEEGGRDQVVHAALREGVEERRQGRGCGSSELDVFPVSGVWMGWGGSDENERHEAGGDGGFAYDLLRPTIPCPSRTGSKKVCTMQVVCWCTRTPAHHSNRRKTSATRNGPSPTSVEPFRSLSRTCHAYLAVLIKIGRLSVVFNTRNTVIIGVFPPGVDMISFLKSHPRGEIEIPGGNVFFFQRCKPRGEINIYGESYPGG